MTARWSTPGDVAAKVRRRWVDGSLLRAHAANAPFPVIDVPLRGPRTAEIGDDVDAVRSWVSSLDAGRHGDTRYRLEWIEIGGRHYGRNRLPGRAVVDHYEQVWAMLGVAADVGRFEELLDLADGRESVVRWVLERPHQAIALHQDWTALLAAHDWLDAHRGSDRYLREISAPGVDTKFAERHRVTLAAMLVARSSTAGFLADLGLRGKPELVRLRVSQGLGLPVPLTELTVRGDELAELALAPTEVIVVENEITFLSIDVPRGGMVLWGKGFEVDRVGRLPWLVDADVRYWGDLDTHGFAILDRLRAWLPQTRSLLMDRATLLAHRDRWGSEERPARSRLSRLTLLEQDLYDDLVTDRLGHALRLEQERIDWAWVRERIGLGDHEASGP